jgi:hypothetical protein
LPIARRRVGLTGVKPGQPDPASDLGADLALPHHGIGLREAPVIEVLDIHEVDVAARERVGVDPDIADPGQTGADEDRLADLGKDKSHHDASSCAWAYGLTSFIAI